MDPAVIAALIGGAGLGPVIVTVTKALLAWATGTADREKSRLKELVAERDLWKTRADRSAQWRRDLQEYVASLRLLLIDRGTPASELPPWPPEPPLISETKQEDA